VILEWQHENVAIFYLSYIFTKTSSHIDTQYTSV